MNTGKTAGLLMTATAMLNMKLKTIRMKMAAMGTSAEQNMNPPSSFLKKQDL